MSDAERDLKAALEEELSRHDWAGAESVSIDRLTLELTDWDGNAASVAPEIAGEVIAAAGGQSSKS